MYDFRNVMGHVEVYLHGSFLFSADTMEEARREIANKEHYNVPWDLYFSVIA